MIKVSVVMPIYNKEKHIRKAIKSILNQTLKNWQLIIVDDGSTDRSLELCQDFKDSRIQVIHVDNGGVSRARNIGIRHATGEYLAFIDSDDYVESEYLEKLTSVKNDFVISGIKKVSIEGNKIDEVKPKLENIVRIVQVAQSFYKEQMDSGIYGYVAGKMLKRKIVEENNIMFDETITLAEDLDFFLKVYAKVESIFFSQYAGYYYTQETENSAICMNDRKIDFMKQIQIHNSIKEFLQDKRSFREWEQRRFYEQVTGYVYTIFIMNECLSYQEFGHLFKRVKEYVPELSAQYCGMKGITARWYNNNSRIKIYFVLRLRKMLGK